MTAEPSKSLNVDPFLQFRKLSSSITAGGFWALGLGILGLLRIRAYAWPELHYLTFLVAGSPHMKASEHQGKFRPSAGFHKPEAAWHMTAAAMEFPDDEYPHMDAVNWIATHSPTPMWEIDDKIYLVVVMKWTLHVNGSTRAWRRPCTSAYVLPKCNSATTLLLPGCFRGSLQTRLGRCLISWIGPPPVHMLQVTVCKKH